MKHKFDSNQIPILRLCLRVLQVLGGYRKQKNVVSYFTMLSLIFIMIIYAIDMCYNWNGIHSLKRIQYMPAAFIAMIKGVLVTMYANELIDVMSILKYFWTADEFDSKTKTKFANNFKFVTIICPIYFLVCLSTCCFIATLPWLVIDSKKSVILDFYFCENYWCWFSMWMWQSFLLLIQEVPISCGFDSVFIICTAYIYNACELLKVSLQKLNIDDCFIRHSNMKHIVDQHKLIMTFVTSVDEMYTVFMLIQFWCSLWSLILYLYMMVVDGIPPKIGDVLLYGTLYLIFTFQLLIYSLGGTIIQEQLNSIPNAFFDVQWYPKGRTNFRKDLSFMIMRAQNARILSVGKLSNLNLPLLVNVIKNSLSVFTLIMQFDSDDGDRYK